MREIKFRAWDTEEKVMWQPLTLDDIIRAEWEFQTDPYEYTLPWKDYMWSQHDKTVWMQYTGIKDRKGKDIYEGDIVDGHADGPGKIEWQKTGWIYTFDDMNCVGLDEICFWFGNNATVIGNIYENPDLLT